MSKSWYRTSTYLLIDIFLTNARHDLNSLHKHSVHLKHSTTFLYKKTILNPFLMFFSSLFSVNFPLGFVNLSDRVPNHVVYWIKIRALQWSFLFSNKVWGCLFLLARFIKLFAAIWKRYKNPAATNGFRRLYQNNLCLPYGIF